MELISLRKGPAELLAFPLIVLTIVAGVAYIQTTGRANAATVSQAAART